MKLLIIDGQGGNVGKLIIEQLKVRREELDVSLEIIAVGTNSVATAAMLKAGADRGATGENPVIVNSRMADIIAGPIGIVLADSLLGEITPSMASAVGGSAAEKVLLPSSKCNIHIAGLKDVTLSEYIKLAADEIIKIIIKK